MLCGDGGSFARWFRDTPLRRAKREGLARNAAVVLGNRRDPRAVPALRHALHHDPSPMVREHAAWALGRIGTPQARQALQEALAHETHPEVRERIQRELARFAPEDAPGG